MFGLDVGGVEWVPFAQGAAITAAFLYLVWQLPRLAVQWMTWKTNERAAVELEAERVRRWQSEERAAERLALARLEEAVKALVRQEEQ